MACRPLVFVLWERFRTKYLNDPRLPSGIGRWLDSISPSNIGWRTGPLKRPERDPERYLDNVVQSTVGDVFSATESVLVVPVSFHEPFDGGDVGLVARLEVDEKLKFGTRRSVAAAQTVADVAIELGPLVGAVRSE